MVRDALIKSGDQEAIEAFNNIEVAVTDYVTQWVEERIRKTDEKVEHLARIVEDMVVNSRSRGKRDYKRRPTSSRMS